MIQIACDRCKRLAFTRGTDPHLACVAPVENTAHAAHYFYEAAEETARTNGWLFVRYGRLMALAFCSSPCAIAFMEEKKT